MKLRLVFLATSLLIGLSGCGGGDASPINGKALNLSGTAAVGLAIANAPIQAKCQGGSSATTTGADGSYKLVIADASLPCALRVSFAGNTRKLHSLAAGATDVAIVNVTPLTELLAARALGADAAVFFDQYQEAKASSLITPAALRAAQSQVSTMLSGLVDTSALPDFVTTPLTAATPGNVGGGNAHDKLLDELAAKVSESKFKELNALLASAKPLPHSSPGPFSPMLQIEPPSPSIGLGKSTHLMALTNYPEGVFYIRQPLKWSVIEADGGSIDAISGRYVAPMKPGTYHVRAIREDYPAVQATVALRVADFHSLQRGSFSALTTPENLVLRDPKAWNELWTRHAGSALQQPSVDFTKDMVLAVFLGNQPNGCHAAEITSTSQQASKLVVGYRSIGPSDGMICTTVITQPYHLVSVPRSDTPVEFVPKP